MKIIFLDIDGVLNSDSYYETVDHCGFVLGMVEIYNEIGLDWLKLIYLLPYPSLLLSHINLS